jgi:hypothetical protein
VKALRVTPPRGTSSIRYQSAFLSQSTPISRCSPGKHRLAGGGNEGGNHQWRPDLPCLLASGLRRLARRVPVCIFAGATATDLSLAVVLVLVAPSALALRCPPPCRCGIIPFVVVREHLVSIDCLAGFGSSVIEHREARRV